MLIGGATAYDMDRPALAEILAEWAAGGDDLSVLNRATVFDDHAVDRMFGGFGRNGFFSDDEDQRDDWLFRRFSPLERATQLGARGLQDRL